MNHNIKKIVAREILIAICTIIACFLFYWGTYPYNSFKDWQVERAEKEIETQTKLHDSLNSEFDYKQRNHQWFFDRASDEFSIDVGPNKKYDNEAKLWDSIQSFGWVNNPDSVDNAWNRQWYKDGISNHFKNMGFTTPQQLYYFIKGKTITVNDSLNNKKAITIQNEIDTVNSKIADLKYSKLNSREKKTFSRQFSEIFVGLVFGVRYIYYLVKWCILTLRDS